MLARAKTKIPEELFPLIRFETIPEKEVAQILHLGSYDDEPATFAQLEEFIAASGHRRLSKNAQRNLFERPAKNRTRKTKNNFAGRRYKISFSF